MVFRGFRQGGFHPSFRPSSYFPYTFLLIVTFFLSPFFSLFPLPFPSGREAEHTGRVRDIIFENLYAIWCILQCIYR